MSGSDIRGMFTCVALFCIAILTTLGTFTSFVRLPPDGTLGPTEEPILIDGPLGHDTEPRWDCQPEAFFDL